MTYFEYLYTLFFQSSSEFKLSEELYKRDIGNSPFNPLLSLRGLYKYVVMLIYIYFQSSSEFKEQSMNASWQIAVFQSSSEFKLRGY